MASFPHVRCLFGAPDRVAAVSAVARTIGLIQRRNAISCAEIARVLDCSPDTIERAAKEESLLSYDLVAKLRYFFSDCCDSLRRLEEPAAAEPPSLEDRLERIEHEAAAIRREMAA